jgi:hypothetical protein
VGRAGVARSRPRTISACTNSSGTVEAGLPDGFLMDRLRPDPAGQILVAAHRVLAGIIWSPAPKGL